MAHLRQADHIVWHDCWPSLELFVACATQWRILPMGGLQGLDYTAVRSVLQMHGVLDQREAFDDIRWLERGALAALAKKPLDEVTDG